MVTMVTPESEPTIVAWLLEANMLIYPLYYFDYRVSNYATGIPDSFQNTYNNVIV